MYAHGGICYTYTTLRILYLPFINACFNSPPADFLSLLSPKPIAKLAATLVNLLNVFDDMIVRKDLARTNTLRANLWN